MIMGGHEHDGQFAKEGNVYITKALANAKTAYMLSLTINKKKKKIKVLPRSEKIDQQIMPDSAANTVVQKWITIADQSFVAQGFDINKVVMATGEPLDGRESAVRSHSTNLTKLIVSAMQKTAPEADVVIMNAGSIRVDDILPAPFTQYDILRTLPFGGGIKEVEMKGSLLVQVLNAGLANEGSGGYLHYNNELRLDSGSRNWMLKNSAIAPASNYRVACTDFLLTGGEANMGFLTTKNKEITRLYPTDPATDAGDLRKAVISFCTR